MFGGALRANSTDRACFAKLSATWFLSREIQEKEIHSKESEREITSAATPYSSAFEASDFRTLISVAESDSQRTRATPRSLHFSTASRMANPSASSGE
ncbi:unnamed protein product [Brassica rapa subsp. trilocularis]